MTRSTAALIIAVLFHLLILLLLWLLGTVYVKEAKPAKVQEQRIKVALREQPKAKRNAALENKLPPAEKIPPMPKGSQLEKLPAPAAPQQQPAPRVVKPITAPKQETVAPKTETHPPEKPYIPFTKVPEPEPVKKTEAVETNATEIPKEHQKLFAKLSKKQFDTDTKAAAESSSKRESRLPDDIREAYGDAFGKLTEGERKYLLDNQEIMRRLTQAQLDDTGSTMIPNTLRVNDYNVVEFYLHSDGSMTDFRYVRHSGFFLLDEVTKETIESVYWKYPRPQQTTLIRYRFGYYLRGY